MQKHIIKEAVSTVSYPTDVKTIGKGKKIRMVCILQTVNDVNRNGRTYNKNDIQESLNSGPAERMKNRDFLGELDHPINSQPVRQSTVMYKAASHLILETWWEGNKLYGLLETLAATKNGRTMRDYVILDKVPIGFSYRGIGELKPAFFNGKKVNKVVGPMTTITWDCVSYPSHKEAKLIKLTESVRNELLESVNYGNIVELDESGMVCTKEGVCYIPNKNDLDRFVETRKKQINKILFG